ncbi:PPE family protein [Mycolicibacterium wolinskyi]|nr:MULTISPECIES: PPE family protein [Mycolicibacterium]MCV7283765.1 PPE family protein [Mycolicibacterium wolinskyi]MCV7297199.1 PPE family protein [Mycolicibacterium goodii]
MTDYGALPPEINSGRMYAGPGSGPMVAAAAAWHALAAELGSVGAAYQAVVDSLIATSWQGPSSLSMATAAAPYVVWILATAAQSEAAGLAATQAAAVFETARAGVVPPAVIEANRNTLQTLIATNFLGVNTPAIAATIAAYDEMWVQDATVLYGYSADAAGLSSGLAATPFIPPPPNTNPAGLAAQGLAVTEAGGKAAGNASQKVANASLQTTSMPGNMDAQSMLSMGPQFMSMIPQALQGFSQPATAPLQSMGQFQSLLSPLMGALNNPGLTSAVNASGVTATPTGALSALGGGGGGLVSGGAGPVSAALGRGGSISGLSVPATWAAGTQTNATSSTTVVPASATTPTGAVPASGTGMAGAPVGAMGGRDGQGDGGQPRYGTVVRVLPDPR